MPNLAPNMTNLASNMANLAPNMANLAPNMANLAPNMANLAALDLLWMCFFLDFLTMSRCWSPHDLHAKKPRKTQVCSMFLLVSARHAMNKYLHKM